MRSDFKSGFVTIVGRPNVGKSTLMNHLIGQKIAITSRKPQTTRNTIRTIHTDEEAQIVFVDTPGVITARNKLGEYMVKSINTALEDMDAVLWVVDASSKIGGMDRDIAKKLSKARCPIILIVNKVDKIPKNQLMEVMKNYSALVNPADTICTCAIQGTNMDEIIRSIKKFLPYGDMYFDEDSITDQPMRQIVAEIVREKALRNLGEEIPHGIAVATEQMTYREEKMIWDIECTIICERDSHKGIIIGKGGQMLRKIGSEARADIEEMVEGQVNLKLWVKVRKEWRNSDILLKNFGYDKNNIGV